MQWLAAAYPAPTSTTATDTLYLPVGNKCTMEHSCLAQHADVILSSHAAAASGPSVVILCSAYRTLQKGANSILAYAQGMQHSGVFATQAGTENFSLKHTAMFCIALFRDCR